MPNGVQERKLVVATTPLNSSKSLRDLVTALSVNGLANFSLGSKLEAVVCKQRDGVYGSTEVTPC
jgi:hypothetical protein